MSGRAQVIAKIEADLCDRPLVWFGTRGDDAEGVADIANLQAAFSIIGRYSKRATVAGYALEDYSGLRVDLDTHDIDEDPYVEPIRELRSDLLAALTVPSVVFTYRPSSFLSAVCFSRIGRAEYLGMFKDHQSAFEHKPWVETAVAAMDLPRVPWRYIADIERDLVLPMFRQGPVVLRRSRSSGGTGVHRVDDPDQLAAVWPQEDEAFVSVAPFIDDAVPVNVGAVVWVDGVTVDLPSVQLIGILDATTRPFGYCGNDFAAVRDLPRSVIETIESATTRIGAWMGGLGYRGTFGVDFLVHDGIPLFMEVNARFQGSSHASSHIARSMGESCLMTDHLSALMGHQPGRRRPLAERVNDAPPLSHLVVHQLDESRAADSHRVVRELAARSGFHHADVVHPPPLQIDHGATVARATFGRSITRTGFDLANDLATALITARRKTQESTVRR
jgi:hypothetical protein